MFRKKGKALLLALTLVFLSGIQAAAFGKTDYVLDTDGKTHIPVPVCYRAQTVYTDIGTGGTLNNPADIYTDKDCNLFIADTDNNRIVKLARDGSFIAEYTCGGTLSTPKGIFVSEQGDIFISDSGNERIVHTDKNGKFIEEFTKPDSDMLDKDMDFSVNRIRISNQGYLMMIKGTKFMAMDADNEFKGYIGSNKLGFSLKRTLLRIFASDEQKSKLLKDEPVSYNSFDIAQDGMIYAVTAEEQTSGQIRKINAVGENVYPVKVYGEQYYNEHTQKYNAPRFASIAVDSNDMIYVLEQYSGKIYVYDQEGSMLCAFGGMGKIKGLFSSPTAIEVDESGNVYVLDSATGYIHIFTPTDFIKRVFKASGLYSAGEYQKSADVWKEVLQTDANYNQANLGYSRCLYKLGDNKNAEYYAELAEDKSVYSDAFSETRYEFFQNHFALVVVIIAAVGATITALAVFLRKTAARFRNRYYDERMKRER